MKDTVDGFSRMLRQALDGRIAVGLNTFVDMVADEVVMEFPFAPPGLPAKLEGRAAIIAHLATLANEIEFAGIGEPTVYAGADPEFTVIEFTGEGRGVRTGAPYQQRYVSLVWTKDGRIVRYRDYWDPLVVLRAIGRGSADGSEALDWHSRG